jgi:hypothetical protein
MQNHHSGIASGEIADRGFSADQSSTTFGKLATINDLAKYESAAY